MFFKYIICFRVSEFRVLDCFRVRQRLLVMLEILLFNVVFFDGLFLQSQIKDCPFVIILVVLDYVLLDQALY